MPGYATFIQKKKIGVIAAYLFIFHFYVEAQDRYLFERYSSNNGLSMGGIQCMVQDKDDFLWVGTRDGLNRFDGNRFTVFNRNQNDSSTLIFNQVLSLQLDTANNLWIGGIGGISVLRSREWKFKNFPFPTEIKSLSVNSIFIKSFQNILLATDHGILSFNTLFGGFQYDSTYNAFKSDNVNDIYADGKVGILIATSIGLYRMHDDGAHWLKIHEGNVLDLDVEQNHVMVSTSSGLFQYEFLSGRIFEIKLPDGVGPVKKTLRTKDGDLWIAGEKVAVLDRNKKVKALPEYEQGNIFSLSENTASTIYETRDRVVWVGTRAGLNKYNPDINNFHYLGSKSRPALSTNYVTSIYTNTDSLLYVGTSRGLNIVDLKNDQTTVLFDETPTDIFKVKRDSRGRIWVSTDKGFYQIVNGKPILKSNKASDIIDFIELDEKKLAFALRDKGLFLLDTENSSIDTLFLLEANQREIITLKLLNNHIWVGCNDGLRIYTLKGELKRHFQASPYDSTSLPANNVRCIFNDHRNKVWIGTWGGGLSKFNSLDSTFSTIDVSKGLRSNVVYGILEDHLGTLWISTNAGLSAYAPQEEELWSFDNQDGLQGNEFNTGSYFQSLYGTMYFGGPEGLTFFYPRKLVSRKEPPKILITQINNGKNVIDEFNNNPVLLPWRRNNLSIEFTVIDFKEKEKCQFQYSLDNEAWVNIAERRYLEFVDLNSGKHQIRIRARKQGSNWSVPMGLSISISREPWRNPWAIGFVIILLLAIIYSIYLFRLKELERKNQMLNRIIKERTRETQIKNEEILAQNEELTSQTEQLVEKNLLLEQSKMELELLSSGLEKKVNERTKDIRSLNDDLMNQNLQIEQFSFITAHNFNGPIARIKGLIEITSTGKSADLSFDSFISMLRVSVSDLDQVMQDLKKILHIKRTSKEYFEPVRLLPVLTKTLESFDDQIKSASINIDISRFEDLVIFGARPFVQSIFYNLIDNGIKYSNPRVDSHLQISCFIEGRTVRILFIDNGLGIDLKMAINKIFRLYQRFTLGTPGKGLGLYMVKTQVETMSGEILVDSTVGSGTTFALKFPIYEDTADEIKVSISSSN